MRRSLMLGAGLIVCLSTMMPLGARGLGAQDTPETSRTPVWGVLAGMPHFPEGSPEDEAGLVGLFWTQIGARTLAYDLAVVTVPEALSSGLLLLGTRLNVAYAMPTGAGITVLPTAGASLMTAIPWTSWTGLNAGVAGVVVGAGTGVRAGVSLHWFPEASDPFWLFEIGLAFKPRDRQTEQRARRWAAPIGDTMGRHRRAAPLP